MKAVFDAKVNSTYDDRLEERYHFPSRRDYLEVARAAIGDWILYREPQRNKGRKGYIGAAQVVSVEQDSSNSNYAYAYVRDYFPFAVHVPFAGSSTGLYWEANLRLINDPRQAGRAVHGKSMRPISNADFDAIISAGLGRGTASDIVDQLYADQKFALDQLPDLIEVSPESNFEYDRKIQQILLNRRVRDANFRRIVCEAYNNTCAVTGLSLVNARGNSEVQAAHIWPVKHGGPDIVQNGLALSGTIHWLFDNFLISLTDDLRLIFAKNQNRLQLSKIFNIPEGKISSPHSGKLQPATIYIQRHRRLFEALRSS